MVDEQQLQHYADARLGTLNLLADDVNAFTHAAAIATRQIADVISIVLMLDRRLADAKRRAELLQSALDSRVLIERAKGVLAERLNITDQAFDHMRRTARHSGRHLQGVCRDVGAGRNLNA